MKIKLLAISLMLAMLLPLFSLGTLGATESVEDIVYKFLTTELDLNPAAAAGIMGNIAIECRFDPTCEVMDTNDKLSFGLMMWNGPRYETLKKWCAANGYKHTDPRGQLGYLKWELTNTEIAAYVALKNVPNTIEGACQATILWAEKFERCTRTSFGLRICETLNTYWPEYADGSLSKTPGIYGYYYNVPINLKYGEALTLYGAVVSYSSALKSVTVGVYTEDGQLVTGKTLESSTVAKNIAELDRYVVFNKIPKGNYYYTITAVNKSGSYVVEKFSFTVSNKETTTTRINESEGGIICDYGSYCPQLEFSDVVPAVHWSHEDIDFVLSLGLMKGLGNGKFAPTEKMNRAMFVTLLSNIVNHYELDIESSLPMDTTPSIPWGDEGYVPGTHVSTNTSDRLFTDVKSGSWYEQYVTWAANMKLVSGKGNGKFDPEGNITRAEVAVLFYRLAGRCGIDTTARAKLSDFADGKKVPSWATDAVSWAVASGLLAGSKENGKTYLNPGDSTTREQVAAIVHRFTSLIENY